MGVARIPHSASGNRANGIDACVLDRAVEAPEDLNGVGNSVRGEKPTAKYGFPKASYLAVLVNLV
jgi:hypothetical protein